MEQKKPNKRARNSVILLVVVFLAPVIISTLMYRNIDSLNTKGVSNHGDLISPARPLPAFSFDKLDGGKLDSEYLKRKWTLVYIDSGECDEVCRDSIYKIRQIRLATGDGMRRIQRLLLLTDTRGQDKLKAYLKDYEGMETGIAVGAAAHKLLKEFTVDDKNAPAAKRIYIVDPIGNLMMKYDPGAEPKGVIKDMNRLLRFSQVG